jgi:GDPmannose 4,6-dehydratase
MNIPLNKKKVLITGVSGQDGSYMVDYLLEKTDCEIFGMVRRLSNTNYSNLEESFNNSRFQLVTGDLSDSQSINKVVEKIKPDYFINLAAQSFVGSSWDLPEQTMDINAIGVLRCLEAIKRYCPNCRFYNAGSSEEFGDTQYKPQDEKHPLRARSPYGASKIAARQLVKVYRESFGIYAIQGILFNHESERRGEEFVTRKITKGIARIVKAIQNKEAFEPVRLGNMYALRDWSHAKDFVDGIWRMLNQPIMQVTDGVEHPLGTLCGSINHLLGDWEPKEYVLASGETHTVKEFAEIVAKEAGFEFTWVGAGSEEKMVLANYLNDISEVKSQVLIEVDPKYYRPAEVSLLLGDSTAARNELGWKPQISFDNLAKGMIKWDLYESGVTPQPTESACCHSSCECSK